MSYNIDSWKTKRLENLIVPLKAFYVHEREDWHPKQPVITDAETNAVTIECGCEQKIKGVLTNGQLRITELDMSGEGSGTFYNWILKPALKQSEGILEAVLIWEGGDSISRLIVKAGKITEKDVEL